MTRDARHQNRDGGKNRADRVRALPELCRRRYDSFRFRIRLWPPGNIRYKLAAVFKITPLSIAVHRQFRANLSIPQYSRWSLHELSIRVKIPLASGRKNATGLY